MRTLISYSIVTFLSKNRLQLLKANFSKNPAKKSLLFSLHGGKIEFEFYVTKFKFYFPPCRLKIFLAGFLEKFAFKIQLGSSTWFKTLATWPAFVYDNKSLATTSSPHLEGPVFFSNSSHKKETSHSMYFDLRRAGPTDWTIKPRRHPELSLRTWHRKTTRGGAYLQRNIYF